MTPPDTPFLAMTSGAPWHLSLIIRRIGPDLLCNVHGGDEHIGAVATCYWDGRDAQLNTIRLGLHKEGPLVSSVARQICVASETNVVCVAGIHYDDLNNEQIQDIVDTVHTLSANAANAISK